MSKELKIRFTSDIAKASRDLDVLSNKIDKIRLKAASAQVTNNSKWSFGSSAFSDRAFARPQGWQNSPAFNRGQMPYSGAMPWFNKSDYGMGGMTHLQGNPVAQKAVSTVASVAQKAVSTVASVAQPVSKFRSLIDSINPKLTAFLSSTGLVPPELARLVGGLGTFGLAVAGAVVALKMIIAAAKKTFEFGNLVEGSKIQLTQFLGSEKAAIKDITQARKFSLLTPFGPAEVLGATASARQFGIDPFGKNKYGLKGNKTAMDIIGGLASFRNPMTGESIGMGRAAYAVAGGDTRLLRPFGSDVRAAYETAKGAGPLRSQAFTAKFLEELGKLPKVLNMAEAQSNSMLGMWSTIAGFAEEFWMALSGAAEEEGVTTFWSQMKDIVRDVRDTGLEIMTYIMPYVTEYGAYLGASFKFVWDMLKEVWHLLGPVLVPVFKILIQLGRALMEIFKITYKILIGFAKILVEIIKAPFRLLEVLTGGALKVEQIIDKMMEFVTGMQVTFQLLGIFIDAIVEKIVGGIDRIIYKFTELYAKHGPLIKTLNAIVAGGAGIIQMSGEGGTSETKMYKTEAEARAAEEEWEKKRSQMTIAEKLTSGRLKPQFISEEKMNEIKNENSKKWDKTRSNWEKVKEQWNKLDLNPFWSDEDEKKYQESKKNDQGSLNIERQINNIIYNYYLPFTPVINTANDSGRVG